MDWFFPAIALIIVAITFWAFPFIIGYEVGWYKGYKKGYQIRGDNYPVERH